MVCLAGLEVWFVTMGKMLTRKKQTGRTAKQPAVGPGGTQSLSVPVLELERFEGDSEPNHGLTDICTGSINYAWLGSGQCGGRLVKSFYDLGYRKTLAVNTTHGDLDTLEMPANQKFLMNIGAEGAGKDMSRGRDAVSRNRQEILHNAERIFGGDVDHIMVCFGAGGGTGSGSATGLIEAAQTYMRHIGIQNSHKSVGVVMTLPTIGEAGSPKVAHNAYTIASELSVLAWQGKISPLVIIDNARISKIHPRLTVKTFWPTINQTVAGLFDIFNRLSYMPSEYTSFDPTDYYSIMSAGGCAIMGLTQVKDIKDKFAISRAIKNNLERTLLASDFDLSSAKVAGSIVVGGKKLMENVVGLQDNIDYGFDVLANITGSATIHRGIYEDDRDTLRVYTVIGGLPSPMRRLEQLRV